MRNVLFEPKPTPRGRASREQQSATDSQAQGSSAQANAGPMIMASTNPTPTGTGPPATAPSATIAPATAGGPTDADLMTPAETEVALGSLIDAFNELRSKSLPGVFETLYEQFLMEQDELDLARAQEDARAANADPGTNPLDLLQHALPITAHCCCFNDLCRCCSCHHQRLLLQISFVNPVGLIQGGN